MCKKKFFLSFFILALKFLTWSNSRIHELTSNNQRLWSAGDTDRRSKCFLSNAVLYVSFKWQMAKNTHDQMTIDRRSKRGVIKLCNVHSIHSWPKSKQMLATYMQRMRNNNLEIRFVDSPYNPQLKCCFKLQMKISNYQILQHSFLYILINFFASTL